MALLIVDSDSQGLGSTVRHLMCIAEAKVVMAAGSFGDLQGSTVVSR